MKRITAAFAVTCLTAAGFTAGCGDDAGSLGSAPTRATTAPATATKPTTVPVAPGWDVPGRPAALFETWFLHDGRLYRAQRDGARNVRAVARRALTSLQAGPWPEEIKAGVSTALTTDAKLNLAGVARATATVRADPAFFSGDRLALRQREAQVVYTLTQYPTIQRVRFTSTNDQAPARTFTRRSFENVAPAIIVEAPRGGATTHSPLSVSGTASAYEGTVSMRILDSAGKEIARTFTTATCAGPCRGDYTASMRYSVDKTQKGTIEVFEDSAESGKPINVVAVPVTLTR